MPQIPIYDQQVGATGNYDPQQAQGGVFSDATGQAVGSLAQGGRLFSEALQMQGKTAEKILGEQNEQRARVAAGTVIGQATQDMTGYMQSQQDAAAPGAPNFTPNVLTNFDKYAQATISGVTDPLARQMVTDHFINLRQNFASQAMQFEHQATMSNRANAANASVTQMSAGIFNGTLNYDQAMDSYNATKPALGPIEGAKLDEAARTAFSGAAAQRLIQQDPVAANKLLQTRLYGQPLIAPTSGAGPTVDQGFEGAMQATGVSGQLAGIARSMYQQESSSGTNPAANTPNSSGALGPLQITQSTFATAQKQGIIASNLSWANPADNLNGSLQYLKSLGATYQNDPAKIAAVWYSGAKAVNPDGSINNFHDPLHPNDPDTNGYVSQVTGRLNASASAVNLTPPSVGGAPATPQGGATGNSAVDNMTPAELLSWSNRAVEASHQVQSQARVAVDQQMQDHEAAAMTGNPPQNPLHLTDFIAAHGAEGPALYQKYIGTLNLGANIAKVASLPPDQQQAVLAASAPKVSSTDAGYAEAQKNYLSLATAIDQTNKMRENDPIGFAGYKGLAKTSPINWNNPQQAATELANRQAVGAMMSSKYGTAGAVFENAEAQSLSATMSSSPPQQQVAILNTMRKGLTDNDAYGVAVAQISKNAPMVGFAGNVSAAPGAVIVNGTPMSGPSIGEQILEGESIWRGTHAGGVAAGTQSPTKLDDTTLRLAYNDQMGNAFKNLSGPYGAKANDETYQAVRDYLTADAVHNGITFEKASEDHGRVANAIAAVTGGGIVPVGSYGNKSNLLVPWGMDQQAFADQFPARAQATLDAAGLKKDAGFDASRYQYDNIGDGKYAFRVGGKYALDPKTGEPLVLDFHQALPPPVPTPPMEPAMTMGGT
ncbi:transglycosylase SLT domain-containing protein [Paraburkholderia domus]|uniref:transglycosylase SLT domain-containing protein n=1 Tax=Paraburkholderia domus TaxID=2793075 RepID=UPI001B25F7DE|nr:transglycosylase SLT domain-containing protein [Paraburkholderia domus]CAE6835233.1 hypothetical protein R75483_06886 [Paraburkholderia domus]